MKTPLVRPSHYLAALFSSAAALFLAGCEAIPSSGNTSSKNATTANTATTFYLRNVDPVEISDFDTDDLKQAFRSVYLALDKLSDERFGPNSGNYQRIRRSVPVKVMMLDPGNATPYQFDEVALRSAQLQQIRDKKGSIWTRYYPSDPTRLRTAKTDWKLIFKSSVKLDQAASTPEEPRFIYSWELRELYADSKGEFQVVAQGKEPLRARNPASLRLKPAKN